MSGFIDQAEKKIIVPRGDGSGSEIRIDIVGILKAQKRIEEVAWANSHTSGELMSTFNRNWLDAARAVTAITAEKVQAENVLADSESDALLAVTDKVLEDMGHSRASAELRKALIRRNPAVRAARDRLNIITTALQYMRDKKQAFENAYTAVKKLAGGIPIPRQDLNSPPKDQDDPFKD